MSTALSCHMPREVSWTTPLGGLFLWARIPGIDTAELLRRSLAEAGVAFVPGRAFFFDGSGGDTLRLSYSLPDEAAIESGIAALARLI
jgi:DNA-binding transcriptional MocR family regulator